MKSAGYSGRGILAFASIIVLSEDAFADDNVTLGADSSLSAGFANNPFSQIGPDTSSGFAKIDATPKLDISTAKTVTEITGLGEYTRYFQHYDDSYKLKGMLDFTDNPSTRVKFHVNLSYDNSIVGENLADTSSVTELSTQGSDLAAYGSRDRREIAQAKNDLSVILSPYDSLTINSYYVRTRYNELAALSDYDGYGAGAGYSRQVTANLQLGIQGSAARYNYNLALQDTSVYTPQVSFAAKLNSYWKVDGAIGISFIDVFSNAAHHDSNALAANINICRLTERTDLCALARRAVLPTGASGTQKQTNAGFKYSYKITTRGTITATAEYVLDAGVQGFGTPNISYFRSSVEYKRAMSQRIDVGITGKYTGVYQADIHRMPDYEALVSISAKLGKYDGE